MQQLLTAPCGNRFPFRAKASRQQGSAGAMPKLNKPSVIVAIESDADWVPWELFACDPGGKLWGERFIVVRLPLIGTPVGATPAPEPAATLSRALLVVGDAITSRPDALP